MNDVYKGEFVYMEMNQVEKRLSNQIKMLLNNESNLLNRWQTLDDLFDISEKIYRFFFENEYKSDLLKDNF